MDGKLNILNGEYIRIVIETDEANSKTIATITNEDVDSAEGYRIRLKPKDD